MANGVPHLPTPFFTRKKEIKGRKIRNSDFHEDPGSALVHSTARRQHLLAPPPHLYRVFGIDQKNELGSHDLIYRRKLLLFQITEESSRGVTAPKTFRAKISLQQPYVKTYNGPQGNRKSVHDLGLFPSHVTAHLACRATAPPIWENDSNALEKLCHLCRQSQTILCAVHHCRCVTKYHHYCQLS